MWYDVVIGVILLYTTYRGATKGLVWQLAWIAALVLCFFFSGSVSQQLAPQIKVEPPLNRWIAMFVLYMGFAFASFAVARVLRGWIEKAKFVEFDRHLGGLFGFLKGVLVAVIMTFFVVTLSESMRKTVLASHSGHAAAAIMEKLLPVLPAELHEVIAPYTEELQHTDFHSGVSGEHRHAGGNHEEWGKFSLYDLFHRNDEQGGDAPSYVGRADDGSESEPSNNTGGPRELLHRLPETIGNQLRNATLNEFRRASPRQREELLDRLRHSLPSGIEEVLRQWQSEHDPAVVDSADVDLGADFARPFAGPPSPSPGLPMDADERIQQIIEIYSDSGSVRRDIASNIRQKLADLPSGVSRAVLDDWYADLMAIRPDPDPETNFDSDLDWRILRRVTAARIPLTQLSIGLQQRLRNAVRR